MRRARVLLPVIAGLLGIAGGVTTALVVPGGAETDRPSSVDDPLRVGVPLVDLTCTGEAVLVLGFGDTAAPIASAVANNPDLGVRYLRTDESCPTVWSSNPDDVPEYVAYAGPYDSMTEPCELRMDGEHKRDDVTNLSAGNDLYVQCLCVLPFTAGPRLELGMVSDATTTIWVRALQLAFVSIDADREARGAAGPFYELPDVTGIYDETIEARVELFQPLRDITTLGVVEADTWKAVADEVCPLYDF